MLYNVWQNEVIEVAGFNFMTGAGIFTHTVVGLANIVCLVDRLPHFSGKTVLSRPANFLIAHLHGLPAGGAINKAMKQVVKWASVFSWDSRAAVNQLLHPIPLFPADNGLMAVLDDLPLVAGDKIVGVGTNRLLMALAYYMIAFINRIP